MLPPSTQPQVRNKLAEYLTLSCSSFEPDISWLYYLDEHNPTMPPMGAVICDRFTESQNYPFNLDDIQTLFNIHLRLIISKDNLNDLFDSLDAWTDYLKNSAIRSLQIDGYEGLFKGIHLNPKKEHFFNINKNQDGGGQGDLHLFLIWEYHQLTFNNERD
jgi:hypothetical protein